MAPTFRFRDGNNQSSCKITCSRCEGTTRVGTRCRRRVCIGLPLCWMHLASNLHLKIKPSTIDPSMKGLFAWYPQDPRKVLFAKKPPPGARKKPGRPPHKIVKYLGEVVTDAQLRQRYGTATAPYAATLAKNVKVDAACVRGAGSLANGSKNGRANNAKFSGNNIVARKNIKHGDEIIVAYGPGYWASHRGQAWTR